MDDELKECAALALRNAFWRDFSALVNKYLEAAAGLDVDAQEMQMGDMTSIYGRDDKFKGDVNFDLWVRRPGFQSACTTILEALEEETATEVHLQDRKVFERRDGEWYFVGN